VWLADEQQRQINLADNTTDMVLLVERKSEQIRALSAHGSA